MKNVSIHSLFSSTGLLVALTALVTIIFLVIVISSFFTKDTIPQDQMIPTPTPYALTAEEKNFPKATPQPFRNAEEEATGTLIVTSNVEDVIVLLDASEHPDPQDPIPSGQKWPKNITPFTVTSMPIGEHVLFAIKPPKYDMATMDFVIRESEVTRVHIELIPLRTSD